MVRLLIWVLAGVGYLMLPRFWGPGWIMVGSPPVVHVGERNPAEWKLYVVNIHNHVRVLSVAARFSDGRVFVVASEPPDTTPSLWSIPAVRVVSLTLPPEAWQGLEEGPHRFVLEMVLAYPQARGMPWNYRYEPIQVVRAWSQTLNLVKY